MGNACGCGSAAQVAEEVSEAETKRRNDMAPMTVTCRFPEHGDEDDLQITVKGWEEIAKSVCREVAAWSIKRVAFAGQDVELTLRWEDLDVQDGATVSVFGEPLPLLWSLSS